MDIVFENIVTADDCQWMFAANGRSRVIALARRVNALAPYAYVHATRVSVVLSQGLVGHCYVIIRVRPRGTGLYAHAYI